MDHGIPQGIHLRGRINRNRQVSCGNLSGRMGLDLHRRLQGSQGLCKLPDFIVGLYLYDAVQIPIGKIFGKDHTPSHNLDNLPVNHHIDEHRGEQDGSQ